MMEENKCGFCHTGEEHESVCGTLHKDKIDGKAVCAHQKCMQYSANWVKFKTDSFGGFQKQAVMKEIERGSTLICAICKADKSKKHKNGATSVCAWEFCRKTFHYLCVSMNPRTVVKQYRVAGEKGVILYSVFCCQDHENRHRKNLIAYGIVGKNGSSDEGGDSQDEEKDNSDTDNEPPAKVPKVSFSQLKDKLAKKEEGESGISSPGMTTKEVLSETQLNIFQRKNSTLDTKENGNDDSFMTATSGHDSGGDDTDDFNTSNSGSEMLENGHLIRNIAEDELKMEDDSGPVTEKEIKKVDEELTSGEMFVLSLEDRKHNKAYRPPKDACIFDGRLITLEKKDISILETVCVKEIGKGGFGNVYSCKS
ncbi:uncharacterized protein LOC128547257 isoform X2 [Mercenaria mercenaria]|nr:uncharacterized protein LOC128547257 isoform X2 [Mercenaria mercenaria]